MFHKCSFVRLPFASDFEKVACQVMNALIDANRAQTIEMVERVVRTYMNVVRSSSVAEFNPQATDKAGQQALLRTVADNGGVSDFAVLEVLTMLHHLTTQGFIADRQYAFPRQTTSRDVAHTPVPEEQKGGFFENMFGESASSIKTLGIGLIAISGVIGVVYVTNAVRSVNRLQDSKQRISTQISNRKKRT